MTMSVTTNSNPETAVEMVDGGERPSSSIDNNNNDNHDNAKGALIDGNGRGG